MVSRAIKLLHQVTNAAFKEKKISCAQKILSSHWWLIEHWHKQVGWSQQNSFAQSNCRNASHVSIISRQKRRLSNYELS